MYISYNYIIIHTEQHTEEVTAFLDRDIITGIQLSCYEVCHIRSCIQCEFHNAHTLTKKKT